MKCEHEKLVVHEKLSRNEEIQEGVIDNGEV